MTPFARLCLASGIGLCSLVPVLRLPQSGNAHARTYLVQANDTLSAIAFRFHIGLRELVRLNGIADADHLQAGQVLVVPDGTGDDWADARAPEQALPANPAQTTTYAAPGTGIAYVVERGDTLAGLSGRFGVPLATLAGANGISHPDLLRIGQRLLIPAQATSGRSTAVMASIPLAAVTSTPIPVTAATTGGPDTAGAAGPSLSAPVTSQSGVGALLTSEAQAYGVDPALVKALAWQESGWQMVVARDGGIGVMQLMPATVAWVGPAFLGRIIDPYNLQDNIQAGVALLASYLRQYGGNVQMALAAYNEGPQNLAHGILSSTAQYIANVLALRAGFAQ